ncbi:MAG: SAM-dependent methyltransferase [Oleiphilus sp.]|nr:MAG: SAM-dependent methyltransferase [Oleiphilus sp.]
MLASTVVNDHCPMTLESSRTDKNFDPLFERFSRRIHGSAKGEIRTAIIQRDLQQILEDKEGLAICDLGAGLGQFTIALARTHKLTYVEMSGKMCDLAQHRAQLASVKERITWLNQPYQEAISELKTQQDLILCHALLEWLAEPARLFERIRPAMKPGAWLSLCFYNPDGLTYRNLIRGNFDWLDNDSKDAPNETSLTPTHPCRREDVHCWLADNGFEVHSESGIRVFSDYVVEKRGGLQDPEKVLKKELQYSTRLPFKHMGRYLHVLARKTGA